MGESAEADAVESLPSGATVGGYTIRRVLGHGGFGITYEAHNPVTGRSVAIKEFFPRHLARRDGQSRLIYTRTNADMVTWALRKFGETTTTLCGLAHPNIVKVHDYLPANDTGYMIMELLDGQTLSDWLRARPAPPHLAELQPILDPVMEALGYVHERGLIHRDIAPDNILITREGRPVLIDFGSASRDLSAENAHYSGTTGVAKRNYTAPEQMRAKARPTPQADVYSMGAVLYRALSGAEPADGMERMDALFHGQRADPCTPLMSHRPDGCPPRAARAIDEALAVRPEQRLRAIADLRAAVQPPPVQETAARRPALAALVLGSVLVAGLGVGAGMAMEHWLGGRTGAATQADIDRQRGDMAAAKADVEKREGAVQAGRAAVDQDRRDVAASKADLDRQTAELRTARAALGRDRGAGVADLDRQGEALRSAKADIDRERKEVDAAKADVERQKSEVQGDRATVDRDRRDVAARKADLDQQAAGLQAERQALDRDRQAAAAGKADLERQAREAQAAKGPKPLSSQEQFNLGYRAYASKDYAKAREWFETAVAGGNAAAMYGLGLLYYYARGVDMDYGEARKWWEKAAAGGNANAMTYLGVLYQRGQGVEQDNGRAREWYEKGAAGGDANALNDLGVLYRDGLGVPRDYKVAGEYFEKGATKGNAAAMSSLGALYATGRGVTRDYNKANEFYRKAAAAGEPVAMNNLGVQYEFGQGVARDLTEAWIWYTKAARAGSATAQAALRRLDASQH